MPPLAALGATLERALGVRPATRLPGPGRRAAVMIVLYEQDAVPHMLLTKRSDHLPSHPGQISLPGGVIEPDDHTERDAALRETEEEVGIVREALRVIGDLDDVHTMVSGFIIHPFVAVLDAPMIAVASDGEVARLIHAPVADLFAADALLPPHPTIAELRYPLVGEDVWGATARILRIFSRVARCALSRSPSPSAGARGGPAR
jgi:8-oxo-dGTP pyrophosphatase MutT (NUDIX family)